MISMDNSRVVKGLLFAGCSFTWGQGLYYYSNMPTLKEPPADQYIDSYVTGAHRRFMESVRFPRIVANHFNTWEVVHPFNGGSNLSAIRWWDSSFNDRPPGPSVTHKQYDYTEFSHVFFQLTQWHRDNFIVEIDGERYDIPLNVALGDPGNEVWPERFGRWLQLNGLTFDQWLTQYIDENVKRVKNFLQEFERNGVRATIILWPEEHNHSSNGDEYRSRLTKDKWLNQRWMKINYNGEIYNSMESLMKHNKDMTIKWDYDNFKDPPKDHHPSLKCHQVMADNIIQRIIELGYK